MADIVGPLPVSEGQRYLLTLVCRTSRWFEALPLPEATSANVCRAFIDGWIRNYGLPHKITCDNGSTFTAKLWKDLNEQLGTIVGFTPIYSPQSLGTLERQHADLKAGLKATLKAMGDEFQTNWMRMLPFIILGRRTSFHGELQTTPTQAVFGQDVRIPGDLIPPMTSGETIEDLLTRVKANALRPPAQTATHREIPTYMPPTVETCTHVYTKKPKVSPLGPKNDGPFPILKRIGKSCIQIKVGDYVNGTPRTETRHWNSCYPADLAEDTESASRPTLGRPKTRHSGRN